MLFLLLRPLSARALAAGGSPLRVAVGGWLASAVLGVAHPLGAIVHALNAMFGAVGKFLGLLLLVLQLVGAGGTFPWQTPPDALYPLHLVLPMGYVVDGLRHLLYTGASLQSLLDIGVRGGWLVAAIAVSVLAARRQRVWTVSKLHPELSL